MLVHTGGALSPLGTAHETFQNTRYAESTEMTTQVRRLSALTTEIFLGSEVALVSELYLLSTFSSRC